MFGGNYDENGRRVYGAHRTGGQAVAAACGSISVATRRLQSPLRATAIDPLTAKGSTTSPPGFVSFSMKYSTSDRSSKRKRVPQ
jgi:hypothetical protein